jgi:hypothetical protein
VQPQNVTGGICDYPAWLNSGGQTGTACSVRIIKTWSYCNEVPSGHPVNKYGARWQYRDENQVVIGERAATYTLDNECTCMNGQP